MHAITAELADHAKRFIEQQNATHLNSRLFEADILPRITLQGLLEKAFIHERHEKTPTNSNR